MPNLNVNGKVLKFKDFDNKSYEVDVNDDDFVIDIKKKLSKKIINHKNIVLMFKNEILFDDKLISDYKIESNKFVLWFEGEDCVRYSSDDSDIIKCITIIDNYSDCEYLVNMNKCSTLQMMKSIIARKSGLNKKKFYLEFNENNLSIDEDATLEQCGLCNACRIKLIHIDTIKVRIDYKIGQFSECNLSKFSTVGRLKEICAEKTGFELKEISLQFNGKCLSDDGATLADCRLSDECTIHLVHDNIIRLIIKIFDNRRIYIYVNKFSTVDKLMQLVKERIELNYFELYFRGLTFRSNSHDDELLNYYDICDDDTLMLINRICGGGRISYNASIIPLSHPYESFEITNAKCLDDFITKISAKCAIQKSLIKLYSDYDKINQITNDQELPAFNIITLNHIQIYYQIISEFDEFQMGDLIGKGSYGEVHKCTNKNTNELFAMKTFFLYSDESEREKLQIEIDCYLKLRSHIRIVKYENHFIDENNSYILMEYMDRGSLGSFVKHNDPLSEHKIAKYARQILEGLEYLHYNRILHRDLKGDNILLNEKDDLKLCDFGLAKILTDISSGDFLNGVVQSERGTLNFRSPEIISSEPYGSPSDIWSFGATMVEIITRKYPHQGLAMGRMVLNIQAGKIIFDYPANSSNAIKAFINSCLKINPEERAKIEDLYQSSFLKSNSS